MRPAPTQTRTGDAVNQQQSETVRVTDPQREPGLTDVFGDVLRRPLSVRAAIVLLGALLLGVGILLSQHAAALERIERQVSSISWPGPFNEPDPETCWLVGAGTYAQGSGPELVAQLSSARVRTRCVDQAQAGAMGRPLIR